MEKEIELSKSGVNSSNAYLTTFAKYGNIIKLDRQVVVDLIDTIYLHEEGEITIGFNFADQHKRVLEFIEANNKKVTYFSKEAKQDLKVASLYYNIFMVKVHDNQPCPFPSCCLSC